MLSSLVNYGDRYLFLSGGTDSDFLPLDSVEKYDISENKWTAAPKLNQERYNHSGCSLNDSTYVFCGRAEGYLLNSIERLNVKALLNCKDEEGISWQIISI